MRIFIDVGAVLIGYVFPFIIVFLGGSLKTTIRNFWILIIVYLVFICHGLPEILRPRMPELRDQLLQSVPEDKSILGMLFTGWMLPLIGGGLGILVRRYSLRRFPKLMNCISFRGSLNSFVGPDTSKDHVP